jgi:hypothetical protein
MKCNTAWAAGVAFQHNAFRGRGNQNALPAPHEARMRIAFGDGYAAFFAKAGRAWARCEAFRPPTESSS